VGGFNTGCRMLKDRTNDFLEIIENMHQLQPKGRDYYKKQTPQTNGVHPKLQFTAAASQIGKQIHDTAQKLGNLTKRKNLSSVVG